MLYRIYSKKKRKKRKRLLFLKHFYQEQIFNVSQVYNICSRLLRQTTVFTKYSSAPVGVRITKKVGNHCSTGQYCIRALGHVNRSVALLTANLHSYFTNGETQYLSHIGALVKCTCSPHSKHQRNTLFQNKDCLLQVMNSHTDIRMMICWLFICLFFCFVFIYSLVTVI